MPPYELLLRCTALLIAAALSACANDAGPGRASLAPASPPAAPAQEPVSEQQASAACWMKYERGRADLPLDARAKLVDQCIAARMQGTPAP